jgi:hypothetical protein
VPSYYSLDAAFPYYFYKESPFPIAKTESDKFTFKSINWDTNVTTLAAYTNISLNTIFSTNILTAANPSLEHPNVTKLALLSIVEPTTSNKHFKRRAASVPRQVYNKTKPLRTKEETKRFAVKKY